jgi:hypothetical protein
LEKDVYGQITSFLTSDFGDGFEVSSQAVSRLSSSIGGSR